MPPPPPHSHSILPLGTQVVVMSDARGATGEVVHSRGAVGVITQAPGDAWHSYRVTFPDGFEVSFRRQELRILAQFKQDEMHSAAGPMEEYDLRPHVIYRCVIGSRAYGLEGDDSDTDRRGVYLPPAELQWSLYGVPEQLEDPAAEEVYWEIQKFLTLALKSNPNVLECLYSPIVEHASDLAREMLDMRQSFLSKMVFQTYNGYVLSQFKKLQAELRNRGEVKWKHVMHLIRLLLSGITVLKEAYVPVEVGEYRGRLLAIRRGEVPFDDVESWRKSLQIEFETAYEQTKLPERPDYDRANAFLIKARRWALGGES